MVYIYIYIYIYVYIYSIYKYILYLYIYILVLVLVWYVAGANFGYRRDGRGGRAAQECLIGGENVPTDDVKMSAEEAFTMLSEADSIYNFFLHFQMEHCLF